MSQKNSLASIDDPGTTQVLRGHLEEILCSPGRILLESPRTSSWTIVPVESGSHFDRADCDRIASSARLHGYTELTAAPTETIQEGPDCIRIPTTPECLREFSRRFGHFNFALLPTDLAFMILCSTDDYFLVCGQEQLVKDIVGRDLTEARKAFDEFAKDPDWPSAVRDNLEEIAEIYRRAPRHRRSVGE